MEGQTDTTRADGVFASCCMDVQAWEEREGEVERLGVRRQETREQGSPSEWKKEKKERERENSTLGRAGNGGAGVWRVVGSRKQ